MLNHNSDLKLENQSCLTKKTVYLRGFPVELTAYSTKKFHLNDNTCLLESVTFRKENRSRPRETLIMFRVKGMLYVPSALLRLYMEIIEIRTNSIDILCISETESDFRLEILPGLSGFSALQFAKRLQMLNNGKGVRKLKELIQYIEIENQTVDDPADIERVKTNDESYFKACYSLNQDLYSKQSRTCKIDDIEDKTAEKINSLQQEIYKNLQDMNFKMEATRDKIHGENSYTKCSTDSKWTDRKKMGNSKVRTQSDQPTWNICLLNREDEAEGLVTEYFGDSMISQAIYEFFGQYIDCEYKGTFERPHVLWPSMHPILPYKFRYLDNRVS
ncbi:unnamed protein product [Mytilus edulis]|uniref:Uncharacterized protein n=1 Tax=Mytilus edulis TaxID=6550 RepID=A0A8S3R6J3_MYTED|nr:unnamed protein product [Mytilus edulis]